MSPTQSRFRRSSDRAVIKDLRDLPGLMKATILREPVLGTLIAQAAKPTSEVPLNAVANIPAPFVPLHEDDELNVCIWKIMADYKGRTSDEIIRVLEAHSDFVRGGIHQCLMALNNMGWFMMIASKAASKTNVYTLKQGIEMPSAQQAQKHNAIPFKQADVLGAANPVGTIIASEGLDVCIWKAMSDRKPRSATEIGEILGAYGMNRGIVKDRALALMRRGWFSRNESKRPTTYTLRKGIDMPPIAQPKEELPMGKDKSKSGPVLVSTKPTRATYRSPEAASAPLSPAAAAVVMKAIAKEPEVPVQPPVVLDAAEGMDICIWKVMSDGKPYTTNEVGLLVQEVGINGKSAAVRMSSLHLQEGWFDRVKKTGSLAFIYTLKATVKCPEVGAAYRTINRPSATGTTVETKPMAEQQRLPLSLVKHDDTAGGSAGGIEMDVRADFGSNDKNVAPEAVLPTVTETKLTNTCVEIPMKPATAFAVPPVENNELVSFNVTVKGVNYTVPQAEQLTRALLEATVDIDGRTFSLEEAIELRKALVTAGFGDKEA